MTVSWDDLWAPVRRGGPDHLVFQKPPDGWSDWPQTLRLTREEWESAVRADYDRMFGKLLCWRSFTMYYGGCLVPPRGSHPQSEYADFYTIRLAWSGASVTFGPYYTDAFCGTERARARAESYLIERGLLEFITASAEGTSRGDALDTALREAYDAATGAEDADEDSGD